MVSSDSSPTSRMHDVVLGAVEILRRLATPEKFFRHWSRKAEKATIHLECALSAA